MGRKQRVTREERFGQGAVHEGKADDRVTAGGHDRRIAIIVDDSPTSDDVQNMAARNHREAEHDGRQYGGKVVGNDREVDDKCGRGQSMRALRISM